MGSIFYDVPERQRSCRATVDAIERRLRAAGRSSEVRGPGEDRDEWQLVVDGVVMATGYCYGSFEKAVLAWEGRTHARP